MNLRVGVVVGSDAQGGAENYLLRLYPALRSHGVEGHLFGRLIGWQLTGLPTTELPLGPKWSRATVRRSLIAARRERAAALATLVATERHHPSHLFHLQFKREQILLTHRLSEFAPVVWTEHGTLPTGAGGRVLRHAYRRAALAVRMIICVSELVADDVRRICGGNVDVSVIENAVDEARFHPPASRVDQLATRARLGLDPSPPVIAVVSRLDASKRLHRIVGAVPKGADVQVVIIGDGDDRSRLETLARGRPVQFRGWLDEVEDVYRAADAVFVAASETGEGVPTTTMLEAAMSRCALVAFEGDAVADEVRAAGGVVLQRNRPLDAPCIGDNLDARRAAAARWAAPHTLGPWAARHAEIIGSVHG